MDIYHCNEGRNLTDLLIVKIIFLETQDVKKKIPKK